MMLIERINAPFPRESVMRFSLPLAPTEEAAVLRAPAAKAPHHHRPAHLHRGPRPAEAVPHRNRALCQAAVSRYHAAADAQHRHKGLLPGAAAPYHRALR